MKNSQQEFRITNHFLSKRILPILLIIIISLLCFTTAQAETIFGMNKVQAQPRDWLYISNSHFKVYYPVGYDTLAYFALRSLNKGYYRLKNDFGFEPDNIIPVIIYANPNEFQETNIIYAILGEGVGGFTESLKNRVVVPFNGSWNDFDYTLRHELVHAFTFDFFFGKKRGGIFSPSRVFELPMWFSEGLAEFESKEWTVEDESYVRDLVINGLDEPLGQLWGFKAYRQGQAVVRYIARKYGRKKLGSILSKSILYLSLDKGLNSAIGLKGRKLYQAWLKNAKKELMPEIGEYQFPTDFARQITDHHQQGNYLNYQPAISPDGNLIAYFSDETGRINLHIMDIILGKTIRVIKGERRGEIESFHPLGTKACWHPTENIIAIPVRQNAQETIIIYDVDKGETVKNLDVNLGAIYAMDYSPDGESIVLSALRKTSKDIYLLDLPTGRIINLTDDAYEDDYPSYSTEGNCIYFASDRPVNPSQQNDELRKLNIFSYDFYTEEIVSITADNWNNYSPVLIPNTDTLIFVSERNGIPNLYTVYLPTREIKPLTNSVAALSSPTISADGSRIGFASFWQWGWDIFLLRDRTEQDSLTPTGFITSQIEEEAEKKEEVAQIEDTLEDTLYRKLESHKYYPEFSPDYIASNLGYSTIYGFQGYAILLVSDILGNHSLLLISDVLSGTENSNFIISYGYSKRRPSWGLTFFHTYNYYQDTQGKLFSDRFYGGNLFSQYPFNRYFRLEGSSGWWKVERKYYDYTEDERGESREDFFAQLSSVKDNAVWTTTGPISGTRWRGDISINYPEVSTTAKVDWRWYKHLGQGYSVALRLAAGSSFGEDPINFHLGGNEGWMNWELKEDGFWSVKSMYMSELVFPLRGYPINEVSGNKFSLLNIEFRYPFVEQLSLGFPLPISIHGLRGALFTDFGTAFSKFETFRGVKEGRLEDWRLGYGVGLRLGVSFLLFNLDVAWSTDLVDTSPHPVYYWTIGTEF